MARRKEAHGGGHGWFVTFADLMGLLVSFFVMLVAFSTQDQAKLQVVAGSMRDAFGVQDRVRALLMATSVTFSAPQQGPTRGPALRSTTLFRTPRESFF